jgi:hypothetical protein
MLGIVFHSPALVNLMVDREKFSTVVVPSEFTEGTQEALETLFSKKPPRGTRHLLLVENVVTLSRVASLFPEQKVRIVVFDVLDNLRAVTNVLPDFAEADGIKKLVALKPSSLNPGLIKMKPSSLEDFRRDYRAGDAIEIAARDGRFIESLKGASKPLQRTACEYLLGLTTFATLKRAARKDVTRVNIVKQYVDSEYGVRLVHAFMDMAVYGTESKESAIFSGADLEDLRYVASLVTPEADLNFNYEVPDKLRLARE